MATPCRCWFMSEARARRTETARLLGWDHAFLEDEAAVETSLARHHDGIGFLRSFVKREPLNGAHRPARSAGLSMYCSVDLGLDLGLHGRDLVGVAHHLHPLRRMLHKAIERHD